jgi:hypothetical protein
MTFAEFTANKPARQTLQKLLSDPVMKAVLEMLQEANLPKVLLQLPGAPPNMDPIQAIAISATHRAGFQHALSLLKKLPTMDAPAERQETAQPWEWTTQPEEGKSKAKRAHSVQ